MQIDQAYSIAFENRVMEKSGSSSDESSETIGRKKIMTLKARLCQHGVFLLRGERCCLKVLLTDSRLSLDV